MKLVAAGLNDCEISRQIGVPRTTVRDMRSPRYVPARRSVRTLCPQCGKPAKPTSWDPEDYCELLGLYLGDGHISSGPRTDRLRISLDTDHTKIVMTTLALLVRVFPHNKIGVVWAKEGAVFIPHVYSKHLRCMFPQAGPGKKHERQIQLESWQNELVRQAPWALLRGLIRSDGCVYINRTGKYEYLSYDFANWSSDILDLFCQTCDAVGVEYRRYARCVRVYRRPSVALLEANVGLKR
jgi:hypothetical protein